MADHNRDQNGVCVRCGACECCDHMVTVSKFTLGAVVTWAQSAGYPNDIADALDLLAKAVED